MNKSKQKSKTSWLSDYYGFLGLHKHIVKVAVLLLPLSVLPFLTACQTTQTDEPTWNDMYEVKTYEVKTETYTNEIITTVFIAKYAETNLYRIPQGVVVEAVGDSFEVSGYDYEASSGTPEFQCVDGSCEVKEK